VFVGQGEGDRASVHSQGLHTSRFDFNDAVIPLAVEYFADLAETRGAMD
jgi:metal-dependent amidase/aminoacylase/carboxypeptidase family protein